MKKINKKQGGFTLIEVVLVLAIGALIILMALLAFNGAQRARRDTARTDAAGQFISALEQSAANNAGTYPATVAAANIPANIKDPKTNTAPIDGTAIAGSTVIVYSATYKCSGSGSSLSLASGNSGGYAISYKQESGTVVCKDNL